MSLKPTPFDRSSLPVGVSGRLDPANPVYGNTATLTLSADSNLTEGSRSIEISGTGERAVVRPTAVTLDTTSSGSGGGGSGGGGGGGGTGVRSFALRETVNDILWTEIAAVQNRLNYFGETRVLDAVVDTTEGVPVTLLAQYDGSDAFFDRCSQASYVYCASVDKVPNRGTARYTQVINKLNRIRNVYGNRTVSGTLNKAEADLLGERFVGEGFTERIVKGIRILISKDRLRQYRSPRPKNSEFTKTGVQANYETRYKPGDDFVNNAHIDIKVPR